MGVREKEKAWLLSSNQRTTTKNGGTKSKKKSYTHNIQIYKNKRNKLTKQRAGLTNPTEKEYIPLVNSREQELNK